ncbi:MAG: hypothetical protein NT154_36930 [Verrucomicrobia bacterium]|nr:hypothetical protein [Verrucomicrobiota bacterium]
MRLMVLIFVLTLVLFVSGCASRCDQPPKTKMIEQAFFSCSKCGSLRGGVFGKGPTKRFQAATASHCVHDWQPVSYDEFKALATQRFGVDWSKEIPYWSRQTSSK